MAELTITNERGNVVQIGVFALESGDVQTVIAGPESTCENIVTMEEARALCTALSQVLGIGLELRPIAPEPAGAEEERPSGILWSSDAMRQFDFGKKTLTGGPQDAEPAGEVGDLVAALEKIGASGGGYTTGDGHQRCKEIAWEALAAYIARKGGGNVG